MKTTWGGGDDGAGNIGMRGCSSGDVGGGNWPFENAGDEDWRGVHGNCRIWRVRALWGFESGDGDEGVMKNTEFQYSELNHNGVFCSACGMVWLKGV